jgi:hypothetical protein
MARSRDISKVLSSNTTLATDAEVAATYQTKAATGLTLLTPTSIANTGGSSSIGATGVVSFTSASAISLNDVFSTTYDNYKIMMNISSANSTANLLMRLRVSGSDNTGSTTYQRTGYYSTTTTISTSYEAISYWFLGNLNNGVSQKIPMEIFDPFKTIATTAYSTMFQQTTNISMGINMTHIDSTSFTGFTLYPSTGTFTGTVSVYGYNK